MGCAMDIILNHVMKNNGITLRQITHDLGMKNRTVSSRLTGLKHRKLVYNGYGKWYYASNVIECDNNQIEITLHNDNVEIWDV